MTSEDKPAAPATAPVVQPAATAAYSDRIVDAPKPERPVTAVEAATPKALIATAHRERAVDAPTPKRPVTAVESATSEAPMQTPRAEGVVDAPKPDRPLATSKPAAPTAPVPPGVNTPVNASKPSPVQEAKEMEEDAAPVTAAPEFSNIVMKNPFGEGEIEVEEISLSDLPGALPAAGSTAAAKPTDQFSKSVTNLKQGDWLEFRDDEDRRVQAKLTFVSPLKGTYLFVNRQGARHGEFSLYELAREFRTGRVTVMEAVPLIDRAMSSLVGVLKKKHS